ncbi:MAG: HEAT repeat domain-containing protein [Elusimicrobia bacterium]|nr:HEAT repeat domain-containing protein [Elusimicrobiota bacterium]
MILAALLALLAFPARAVPILTPAEAFSLGQVGLVESPDGTVESAASVSSRAAAAALLAPALLDGHPDLRRAAVEALGKVGAPSDEASLISAAADPEPAVRGEAALALFRLVFLKRIPRYSPAAIARLSLLAGDPDPEVRWRTVYAASRWPEPRLSEVLPNAARDADWRTRLFAVRSLAKLGFAPDPDLLADPEPYVRAEAVAAFSAAKAWIRLPDALFGDPSSHVRAAMADAAAASGDAARFVPLLERLAAGPGTLAEGRALLALAKLLGGASAKVLAEARQDRRWWLRCRAYEASAGLADGPAILLAGARDADPRVAAQSLETLAASSPTAALPELQRLLRRPDAPLELLGAAVDAAGQRKDPALLAGLLAATRSKAAKASPELRGSIRNALAALGPGKAAAAFKSFPPFVDKPRSFPALRAPAVIELETAKGTFVIALASGAEASVHAAAVADGVARGLYDGLNWHRVVTAFVVQGGDPRGSGWGDAGWRLADEDTRRPFLRGTVGAPKAGKDTAGCQLFVSLVPIPHLDGRYTAFGTVISGLHVLDLLEPGDLIVRARLR